MLDWVLNTPNPHVQKELVINFAALTKGNMELYEK